MKKYFLLFIVLIFSLSNFYGEKIVFSASSMSGKAGSSKTTTKLKGNAYIKTETMEIKADEVELSGEDFRYIKASGNVEGKNFETKMDFSCDNLDYDREEKLAILKGNVKFIDTENEVQAQAESIEYDQKTEISILQIDITLTQEDNVCTGSYGIYYKENQLLELSGNAQVKQKDDVFRAQHITLNLDTQEISLGGNVKGSVKDSKEEREREKAEKEAKKQEAPSQENEESVKETTGEETTENGEKSESEKIDDSEKKVENQENKEEKSASKEKGTQIISKKKDV